jgi:hypothetical protein
MAFLRRMLMFLRIEYRFDFRPRDWGLRELGQRTLQQALTELDIRESAKRTTSKVRLSVQNKR